MAPRGHVVESKHAYYLLGLVGKATVDASRVCNEGVAAVESRSTTGQKLLTVLTIGVYAPRTVTVTCVHRGKPRMPAGATQAVTP